MAEKQAWGFVWDGFAQEWMKARGAIRRRLIFTTRIPRPTAEKISMRAVRHSALSEQASTRMTAEKRALCLRDLDPPGFALGNPGFRIIAAPGDLDDLQDAGVP